MELKTIKTSDLEGAALDWAVAKCEGEVSDDIDDFCLRTEGEFCYSTDWSLGGPIIEREGLTVGRQVHSSEWSAEAFDGSGLDVTHLRLGPTPLIAAMRCFVGSKLGNELDVPVELCPEPVEAPSPRP